jgi:cytochrome c oxidase subunit 2
MTTKTHFTTRRSFLAAAGFGGVSLYGLWAAYGAAPGPLALLGIGAGHGHSEGHADGGGHSPETGGATGGHGGHGAAPDGPSAEEFSRMTAEFIDRYRLPDGVVHPRRQLAMPGHDSHAGHRDSAMPSADDAPIDVLMAAGKFYYLPNALRLDAGQAYRFRMMALDVSHGASIQFGSGGRMLRLRPGRLTETEMTFQRPGRYLVVCTVYCGAAHDVMQAAIEVV